MTYKTVQIGESSEEIFVDDIREALNTVEGLEKKFASGTSEPKEIKTELENVKYLMQKALDRIEFEKLCDWRPIRISPRPGNNQDRKTEKQNLLDLFYAAAEDGYLTLEKIARLAPRHVIEGNQLDRMVAFFVNMGARVFFKPPTEEELEEVKNSPKPDIKDCIHLGSSDKLIHGWYTNTSYRILLEFLSEPTENNGTWRW